MMLIQSYDENRINCTGDNGSIKRKNGKIIKIPSNEEIFALNAKALKDPSKMEEARKLQEQVPKIEEGDTIISGKDTIVYVHSGGDRKKEAGIEDGVYGKSIYLFENTEVKVSGVKHFEKEDEKKDTKYFIDSVKNVEFLKGSFQIISLGSQEEIETPFATIKFLGKESSGFFDITPVGLYTFPQLGPGRRLEYVCKRTKKSYITKDYKPNEPVFPTEIVITNDGIYKVPFTAADNPNIIKLTTISLKTMAPSLEMTKAAMPQQQKMMESLATGEFQNQMLSGFETMKNMKPEDLERMMKMAEQKGGQKVTKEQTEMIQKVPEMLKRMESSGKMDEMKKAYSQAGSMFAGMSEESRTLFFKQQERSIEQFNSESEKMQEEFKKVKKEPYKPLKAEYKVA